MESDVGGERGKEWLKEDDCIITVQEDGVMIPGLCFPEN